MSLHKEMQRKKWTEKITKTTRDSSTYTSNSGGFVAGFVESYYDTTASDNYCIIIGDICCDGEFFNSANFARYTLFEFLKLREEILLRLSKPVKLFETEIATSIPELFNGMVDLARTQFKNELDSLYPEKMYGSIRNHMSSNTISESHKDARREVGLKMADKRRSYLDSRIKLGSISDMSLHACEKTRFFPTYSDQRLQYALNPAEGLKAAAVEEIVMDKAVTDPDVKEADKPEEGEAEKPEEEEAEQPALKKAKVATIEEVTFEVAEDMGERIGAAKVLSTETVGALKNLEDMGVDSEACRLLKSKYIEVVG